MRVFFDCGTVSSWISPDIAGAISYPTEAPTRLYGIGERRGPQIDCDALIRLRFYTGEDSKPTAPITMTCGVCKPGTFPAGITIGRHLFEALHIGFIAKSICFYNLPGRPCSPAIENSKEKTDQIVNFCAPVSSVSSSFPAAVSSVYPVISRTVRRVRERIIRKQQKHQEKDYQPQKRHQKQQQQQPAAVPQQQPQQHQQQHETPAAKIVEMVAELRSLFPGVFDARFRKQTLKIKVRTEHIITTKSGRPIKIPPRRYSPAQEQAIREFINKAIRDGIIKKSKSPWSSPALLVPKKSKIDGQKLWRFCVDYRALNADTVKHAHPLPNVADQIQRAAGYRFYCFLDLLDGFWQILMASPDRQKTAFSTPFGLYEWLVMAFGLANGPATFQAFMEEVLEPLRAFVAGLLDDICVWGDTLEELYSRVKMVLRRLAEYGLVLNVNKCEWFVSHGRFLGFIISREGIRSDPAKISAILERPMPSTAIELRSFLNAAGYFRHFIENFAGYACVLYDLTGLPKGHKITLTLEQQQAWQKLRDALVQAPLLRPYD